MEKISIQRYLTLIIYLIILAKTKILLNIPAKNRLDKRRMNTPSMSDETPIRHATEIVKRDVIQESMKGTRGNHIEMGG